MLCPLHKHNMKLFVFAFVQGGGSEPLACRRLHAHKRLCPALPYPLSVAAHRGDQGADPSTLTDEKYGRQSGCTESLRQARVLIGAMHVRPRARAWRRGGEMPRCWASGRLASASGPSRSVTVNALRRCLCQRSTKHGARAGALGVPQAGWLAAWLHYSHYLCL